MFARHVDLLADRSDDALPDLFGQALFVLGEACLEALLSENFDRFQALLLGAASGGIPGLPASGSARRADRSRPSTPGGADHEPARRPSRAVRVRADLERTRPGLDRAWTVCRDTWDAHFAAVPDAAAVAHALAVTLDIHDMPAIVPGDILRTSRGQRYEAYLARKLGLGDSPFDRHRVRHASPIVEVATEVLGPEAASIFVVEYLAPRFHSRDGLFRGSAASSRSHWVGARKGGRCRHGRRRVGRTVSRGRGVSSQISRRTWAEATQDPRFHRLSRPYDLARGLYTFMLLEDARRAFPYRRFDEDFVAEIRTAGGAEPPTDTIARALDRDRYGSGHRTRDPADALREFGEECIQHVLTFGEAAYELVFWRAADEEAWSSFDLALVHPYWRRFGRHHHYIAGDGSEAGRTVQIPAESCPVSPSPRWSPARGCHRGCAPTESQRPVGSRDASVHARKP